MADFSTPYYVNYDNVDGKKIDAEVNQMTGNLRNIYYLNLFYRYEENAYASFLMKGPEFTCNHITPSDQEPFGESILVKMDNSYNDFIKDFNTTSYQIYAIVDHNKYRLKMKTLQYPKNHIYQRKDENTGEIIPNRQPSMFLSLYDKPYFPKTLFHDMDGNIIDTDSLRNHKFTFIPLLHFYKVNCNSSTYAAIKIYIKEAIVTSILN